MIDNFEAEKWKLLDQETQLSMKIADLDVHRGNISQLRAHLSLIGVGGGLLTAVGSLVYEGRNEDFYQKKIQEDKERYREKAIKEYDEYKAQNPHQNDSVYTKKMIEIENKYFEKGFKRFRPKERKEYREELDKRHNAWIEQIRKNEEQYRQLLKQSK
jgi:hydroxymethylpyrimidine pyrophosphatase-like HAD family hydrolase